ncbi:MAG: tandem-95 repeat protein [Pirellulales bacterium]|nr:tandem-95 repeat protein [Pirellulales bacterium]
MTKSCSQRHLAFQQLEPRILLTTDLSGAFRSANICGDLWGKLENAMYGGNVYGEWDSGDQVKEEWGVILSNYSNVTDLGTTVLIEGTMEYTPIDPNNPPETGVFPMNIHFTFDILEEPTPYTLEYYNPYNSMIGIRDYFGHYIEGQWTTDYPSPWWRHRQGILPVGYSYELTVFANYPVDLLMYRLELAKTFDIEVLDAQVVPDGSIEFNLQGIGIPDTWPVDVGLYRSADQTFDQATDVLINGYTTSIPSGTSTHIFSAPTGSDPSRPYLLVVADPSNLVTESDETNNVKDLTIPDLDLEVSYFDWYTDKSDGGGVDLWYSITGDDLPAPVPISLYWLNGTSSSLAYTTQSQVAQNNNIELHVSAAELENIPFGDNGSNDDLRLKAIFDPANSVPEPNEINNARSLGASPADILKDSVEATGKGTPAIEALFTPAQGALTIDQAATICGVDHFNWLQVLKPPTGWTFRVGPTPSDPAAQPPLYDPIENPALFYYIDVPNVYSQPLLVNIEHDAYLPYLDEQPAEWAQSDGLCGGYLGDFTFTFRDQPQLALGDLSPSPYVYGLLGFETHLVGIDLFSEVVPNPLFRELTGFRWTTDRIYDTSSGGIQSIGVLKSIPGFDPPLYSGSISTIQSHSPVLNPIGDRIVNEEEELTFVVTATDEDVPAETLTYSATGLPDGAALDPTTGVFSWTPNELQGPGSYDVTFEVTDGYRVDTETIMITVGEVNVPPVLTPIGDRSVNEQEELAFVVTASDLDVPVQTLTLSATGLPDGANFDPATGDFSWTPRFDQAPGTYDVTFTVSDGIIGDSETITITVDTSEHVLVRENSVSQSLKDAKNARNPGVTTSTINISESAIITDVNVELNLSHTYDGQLTATLFAPNGTPVVLFSNVGGSGDNFTSTVFDGDASVSITSGTAPFTGAFLPVGNLADFNGLNASGTWTLEISDNAKGNTGTLMNWSLEITARPAPNTPPVAVDDSANTARDEAFTVPVLENDTDVDNDTLIVTDVGGVTPPQNGTVVNNVDSVTYTPNTGFVGTDSFSYTVSDGRGGIDSGMVSITVSDAIAIHVYDIRFEQQGKKPDTWRAVFEIHADVDGDDNPYNNTGVAGVLITVEFAGQSFSGTTDANGIFTTGWIRKLSSGTEYSANVLAFDLVMTNYFWDTFLDLGEEDQDGDGVPDNILVF